MGHGYATPAVSVGGQEHYMAEALAWRRPWREDSAVSAYADANSSPEQWRDIIAGVGALRSSASTPSTSAGASVATVVPRRSRRAPTIWGQGMLLEESRSLHGGKTSSGGPFQRSMLWR